MEAVDRIGLGAKRSEARCYELDLNRCENKVNKVVKLGCV